MSYILGMMLGIFSVIKKRNIVLLSLFFSFLCIIYIYANNIPDLPYYELHYYTGLSNFTEPVYIGLAKLFYKFGVSYLGFRAFLCLASMILLTKTFYDYSPYPNIVLFLYLIYPFTIEVIQTRSFVATSIMVFSIRFIINYRMEGKIRNIFFFIISVIISTGFHYSAILLSIIGLLFINVEKHKFLFYVVLPVVIVMALGSIQMLAPIADLIVGEGKTSRLIESSREAKTITVLFRIVPRIGMLLVLLLFRYVKKDNGFKDSIEITESSTLADKKKFVFYNRSINQILLTSIFYVLLYIPLEIFISGDYERLSRVALILFFILITRYIYSSDNKEKIYMIIISFIFWALYFIAIMYFSRASDGKRYFDLVFRSVMENNPFFAHL